MKTLNLMENELYILLQYTYIVYYIYYSELLLTHYEMVKKNNKTENK